MGACFVLAVVLYEVKGGEGVRSWTMRRHDPAASVVSRCMWCWHTPGAHPSLKNVQQRKDKHDSNIRGECWCRPSTVSLRGPETAEWRCCRWCTSPRNSRPQRSSAPGSLPPPVIQLRDGGKASILTPLPCSTATMSWVPSLQPPASIFHVTVPPQSPSTRGTQTAT